MGTGLWWRCNIILLVKIDDTLRWISEGGINLGLTFLLCFLLWSNRNEKRDYRGKDKIMCGKEADLAQDFLKSFFKVILEGSKSNEDKAFTLWYYRIFQQGQSSNIEFRKEASKTLTWTIRRSFLITLIHQNLLIKRIIFPNSIFVRTIFCN